MVTAFTSSNTIAGEGAEAAKYSLGATAAFLAVFDTVSAVDSCDGTVTADGIKVPWGVLDSTVFLIETGIDSGSS